MIYFYIFSCHFFQQLWHKFFFLSPSNIFCQVLDMMLFWIPCLSVFISIFDFLSVTDPWTFSIFAIRVLNLFPNKLYFSFLLVLIQLLEILFNSFKFCWSSSNWFPCSLMASTDLSVVLIIIFSSWHSQSSFWILLLKLLHFLLQISSFNPHFLSSNSHKWKQRSSAIFNWKLIQIDLFLALLLSAYLFLSLLINFRLIDIL